MSDFWLRAVGDGEYVNSVRFDAERKELGDEIHKATRALLAEAFSGEEVHTITEKSPTLRQFAIALEYILKHGLRSRGDVRSTMWNYIEVLEKIPQTSSTISNLRQLTKVTSSEGRARAWIRLALNTNMLDTHLQYLLKSSATESCYEAHAYIREPSSASFMLSLITGLNGIPFSLSVDDSQLEYYLDLFKTPVTTNKSEKRRKVKKKTINLDHEEGVVEEEEETNKKGRQGEKRIIVPDSPIENKIQAEEERVEKYRREVLEEDIRIAEQQKREEERRKAIEEKIQYEREQRRKMAEEDANRRQDELEKLQKEADELEAQRIQQLIEEQERKRREQLLNRSLSSSTNDLQNLEKIASTNQLRNSAPSTPMMSSPQLSHNQWNRRDLDHQSRDADRRGKEEGVKRRTFGSSFRTASEEDMVHKRREEDRKKKMEEDLRKLLNEEKEKLAQMITTGSLSTTIELDLSLATETTIDDKESVSGIDAEEGREEQSGEREEEEEEAERNGQTEDGHEEREERLGGGEGIERVEIESEGVIEKVHQEILDQTIKDNVGDVADETEEQKREKLNGIEQEKDREEQERRSEEVKREERELESNRPRRQSGIIVTEEEVERKRKEAQERVKQRIARIEEERKRNTPNTQSPVVTRMETHDQDLTKDLEDLDDMLKQVDIEMDSPTQTALRKRIEEERRSKAEEEERRREEEARRIAAEDEDMNSLLEYQMQFKKKRESIRITHNIEEITQQMNTIEENAAERVKADTNRTNRNQMDRLDSTVHTSSIGPDTAFKRDLQDYSRILEAETAAIIHLDHSSDEPVSFSANQDDQWLLRSLKEGEQDKSKPTEPELQTPGNQAVSAISNRYLAKHLTQSRVDAQPSPRFSGFVSPQLVPPVDLSSSIGSGANKNRSRSFGSQGKGRSKSNIFDFRQSLTLDNPLKVEQGTNMVYYVTHTKGRPSDQENICFTCGSRLETGFFSPKPKYCEYTGKYHCNKCHHDQRSIIPARILQNWDFRPYPICDASKAFLELTVDEPVYDISAISSGLFYKVPNLRNVKILRRQLYYLKDYIFNCDRVSQEKVVKEISYRLHIIHNTDIYSLQDLMDLNTEKLIDWIRDLTERFIVHVTKCSTCKERGQICGLCQDPKVIYPFNVRTITECKRCHTPYHRTCKRRSPNCCPICERSGQDGRWDASVDNDTDDIDTVQQFKSGLERGSSFRF